MQYLIEHFPWLSIKLINVPLSSYLCSFLAILGGFLAKLVLGVVFRKAKKIAAISCISISEFILTIMIFSSYLHESLMLPYFFKGICYDRKNSTHKERR